jgi:membrane protease YdiL (CAAX protease family)
MEPELLPPAEKIPTPMQQTADEVREIAREPRGFDWVLLGPQGLRAGWSMLLFAGLYYLFRLVAGTIFFAAGWVKENSGESVLFMLAVELIPLLALIGAVALMSLFEGRRLASYNLARRHGSRNLFSGAAAGFAALSALVLMLVAGGWMHMGAATIAVPEALRFAALWGCVFLAVGLVEEGLFRCYALSTLARGINFWWALAAEIILCLLLLLGGGGNGAWGVYAIAALGVIPCFVLWKKSAPRSGGFWQAAWVTSTVFGFYHTSNGGENWVGIFAAAAIGFVFCVSVRLTGSAWWAIGCHAAWDWAETFFYGTADSGMRGKGHFLSAAPVGNPLWSGGADGPEGSLLVLGAIFLLVLILLLFYRRKRSVAPATEPVAN